MYAVAPPDNLTPPTGLSSSFRPIQQIGARDARRATDAENHKPCGSWPRANRVGSHARSAGSGLFPLSERRWPTPAPAARCGVGVAADSGGDGRRDRSAEAGVSRRTFYPVLDDKRFDLLAVRLVKSSGGAPCACGCGSGHCAGGSRGRARSSRASPCVCASGGAGAEGGRARRARRSPEKRERRRREEAAARGRCAHEPDQPAPWTLSSSATRRWGTAARPACCSPRSCSARLQEAVNLSHMVLTTTPGTEQDVERVRRVLHLWCGARRWRQDGLLDRPPEWPALRTSLHPRGGGPPPHRTMRAGAEARAKPAGGGAERSRRRRAGQGRQGQARGEAQLARAPVRADDREGPRVTSRHFFRNLRGFVTRQEPHRLRRAVPGGARRLPRRVPRHAGARAARQRPAAVRRVRPVRVRVPDRLHQRSSRASSRARGIERYPEVFDIDMSRCMFCGLCEEACPEEAIVMSREVEIATYDRELDALRQGAAARARDAAQAAPRLPARASTTASTRRRARAERADGGLDGSGRAAPAAAPRAAARCSRPTRELGDATAIVTRARLRRGAALPARRPASSRSTC